MAIKDIDTKCFILALFIRDDDERFLLGDGNYEFTAEQLHFSANTMANDVVEVQGNDGYMLAGQVRRPGVQSFDGYIGNGTTPKTDVETARRAFFAFFRKNFFYKVIYIFPDGTAIQRKKGFLVDAPVVEELYQIYPKYHVGLNFEDINYYQYNEDANGNEIFGKMAEIKLTTSTGTGGLIWDAVGVVWDNLGATWEESSGGGPTTVPIDSIDNIYPIWTVTGPALNPELSNITTGETLSYTGNVTSGSTLVIDMFNKTAKLNGTSVIGNVSGDWVHFEPGNNRVTYTTDNTNATSSKIEWQEIVG